MKFRPGLVAAIAALLFASCGRRPVSAEGVIPGVPAGSKVVTLTNLHPDEERSRLYSANFQQPGLIPLCTEVTLLQYNGDYLWFKVNATGKEYSYVQHDAGGEPLAQNLARYFGTTCPKEALAALTRDEKEAVRLGVVAVGMRKEAVVLALGYPPKRDTPSLDLPRWRYWHSHWNSFVVSFDASDRVSEIAE